MSKSQLLIDVLEIELEAIESGTARIRQALDEAVVEVRAHRAMVKRLEEWADLMDVQLGTMTPNRAIAAELRNRMRGA